VARIHTSGAEIVIGSAAGPDNVGFGGTIGTTLTQDASVFRSGLKSRFHDPVATSRRQNDRAPRTPSK
jgi:hypothetical protein